MSCYDSTFISVVMTMTRNLSQVSIKMKNVAFLQHMHKDLRLKMTFNFLSL